MKIFTTTAAEAEADYKVGMRYYDAALGAGRSGSRFGDPRQADRYVYAGDDP